MERTTIALPTDLKLKALKQARDMGISLGELVREGLKKMLNKKNRKEISFFDDTAVYTGPIPEDLSINHDKYLYDEDL